LDDKSFVDTYKNAIIEAAYNDYEDEYDDTYDTSAIHVQGVELHMLDDLDEEGPNALAESQSKEYVRIVARFVVFYRIFLRQSIIITTGRSCRCA